LNKLFSLITLSGSKPAATNNTGKTALPQLSYGSSLAASIAVGASLNIIPANSSSCPTAGQRVNAPDFVPFLFNFPADVGAPIVRLLLQGVVTNDKLSATKTLPIQSFKCKLINARSLNNKLHELQHELSNDNLDLLVCSETWFKPYTPDSVIIADTNYSVFRKDRLFTTAGGVCIFTQNDSVKAVQVAIP